MSDRWKLGDVLVWFKTGTEQDAKTDADVVLNFYSASGESLGWLRAFERGDRGGFEEDELNVGFLGNLNNQARLKKLMAECTVLDIKIETDDESEGWYLENVSLDFRVGPVVDVSTVRTWNVNEWVRPDEKFHRYEADGELETGAGMFEAVGFDKELELESGNGEAPLPGE